MSTSLLILGGTSEASDLARAVADRDIRAVFSYAGRVISPRAQPLPTRTGGFGGVAGLVRYLRETPISHVIDATHPFAAGMSHNAAQACAITGVGLAALSRPEWRPVPGDQWQDVADIDAAVMALDGPRKRVFLALGRLHLSAFAARPQHRYLLRLVDPPKTAPLPDCRVIVARGPFDVAHDTGLMRRHHTQVLICKNSGGTAAVSKLHAARALGVPVLMIARPALPKRREFSTPAQVLDWLVHGRTERGV